MDTSKEAQSSKYSIQIKASLIHVSISNVMPSDSGLYCCVIIRKAFLDSKKLFEVQVEEGEASDESVPDLCQISKDL